MDDGQGEMIELLRDIRKHTRLLYGLAMAWVVITVVWVAIVVVALFVGTLNFS